MDLEPSSAQLSLSVVSGKQSRVEGLGRGLLCCSDLELGFKIGFKTWPSYLGAGVCGHLIWEQAPGACLTEGELVCPCVREEEAGNSALAPPLLQAAKNDPEQGTKGTMQGWGLFSV